MSNATKPRSIAAKIANPSSPSRVPEYTPGPGETGPMYAFGSDSKGVYIGEKRPNKIESTPGPGSYDNMNSKNFTKSRTTGGQIHSEQMVYVDAASLAGPARASFQSRGMPRNMSQSATFGRSPDGRGRKSIATKSSSNLMKGTGHVKMNTLRDMAKQQYDEVDSKKVGARRVKTAKKRTKKSAL